MKTIQIQAYCSQCKKTSWVEVGLDELEGHVETKQTQVYLPPVPGSRENGSSGILKRSLSHGDHVLLLEIDKNGTVRKESVVNLISSVIENIVAQAVEKTLSIDQTLNGNPKTILFISQAYAFHEFFKSVLSILLLNLNGNHQTQTTIMKDRVVLKFNNITLVQVPYMQSFEFFKDKQLKSIVLDVDSFDGNIVFSEIPTPRLEKLNIILAFNSRKGHERPVEMLKDLLSRGLTKISLLDYSSSVGLSNIIESSYENLLA